MKVKGIHHISNIVGHPQNNIDYTTSVLGLRLIKKAVNFDDANTYHFYYGNNDGNRGSIITSFPYVGEIKEGITGGGQAVSIYYIIPKGSMSFWENRLNSFLIDYSKREVFKKTHLVFKDESGIKNELVESSLGNENIYEYNGITKNEAIKGFYGVLLNSTKPEETKDFFINVLGMNLKEEDNNYYRFVMESEIGKYIDLDKEAYKRGNLSKGTVHHVALTVNDLKELKEFKEKIENLKIYVTDIRDRDFFNAIYFREPGGVIIELSTKNPSKENVDFKIDDLGEKLYLPEHFENRRKELEETLIPVFVKPVKKLTNYKYETKDQFESYFYHQGMLKRINELAKIAKQRDLTDEEFNERAELRKDYIKSFKDGVIKLMDTVKIEDENGNLIKLERKIK